MILRAHSLATGEDQPGSVLLSAQSGGAALLTSLIRATLAGVGGGGVTADVTGVSLSPAALRDPNHQSETRVFTRWSAVPHELDSPEFVWRLQEFIGQVAATAPREIQPSKGCTSKETVTQVMRDGRKVLFGKL